MIPGHKRVRCETEFWTDDMPPDATWRPNRHHSNMIPLFRNHVTQKTQWPCFLHLRVLSSQLSMGTETPVCPLSHTSRMPRRKGDAWFWRCQKYPTCTALTTTNPPVPQNLKTLPLKQQTQAVNDRIPAKGCRHLLVKPWANGTRKANTCQLCGAISNDKGEITGTSKSVQRTVEGRTELDRRGRRSQEVAGRSPCGGPSSPEQSNRSSIPGGTSNGGDGTDQETVGGELGTSGSMTGGGETPGHQDTVCRFL